MSFAWEFHASRYWDRIIHEGEARLPGATERAFISLPLGVAYHQRASRSFAQGDLAAALRDVDRAIALDPLLLPHHTTRTVLLDGLGRRAEAYGEIDGFLSLVGARERVLIAVHDWERFHGTAVQIREAETEARAVAKRVFPVFVAVPAGELDRFVRAVSLAPRDPWRPEKQQSTPSREDRDLARARATRGILALREGLLDQAEGDLRRAMELHATALYAHSLGAVPYARGDPAGAADIEARSVELEPKNARPLGARHEPPQAGARPGRAGGGAAHPPAGAEDRSPPRELRSALPLAVGAAGGGRGSRDERAERPGPHAGFTTFAQPAFASAALNSASSSLHAFSAAASYTCESGGHHPCFVPANTSTFAVSKACANASFSLPFTSGCFSSSFAAIAIKNRAFIFWMSRCGLSGLSITNPPPCKLATAPTRSGFVTAVRIHQRPAHAVAHRPDLARLVDRRLLIEPRGERLRVRGRRLRGERPHQRHQRLARRLVLEIWARWRRRRLLLPAERAHHQHGVALLREPLAHLAEGGAHADDIRPHEYRGERARRWVHEVRVACRRASR
ncbi:MAG: hypothetical protein U0359_15075 [Byssovorax sp.]